MNFSHMYLRETGTIEKNIVTYTTDVKHDKKNKMKQKAHTKHYIDLFLIYLVL